jgi:CHAD domain-containing protein
MNAQELLINSLEQRYLKYTAERQRCKDEFSEEAVHDLRIASRRLLALLTLLRAIDPQPRLQQLRRLFKNQLDGLDELRDTQVMLAEISEAIATLPEIEPLEKYLQKREKRLLKTVEQEVRALKNSSISKHIEKIQQDLIGPLAGQDLTASLLSAVDEASSTVNRRMEQVDPAQPATIHRVRIAFKKFRYMVEIIHPILPGFPETQLKSMHDYQTAMGEIQDMEVMLRTLANFASRHKTYDPQLVRQFYEQRHSEALAVYLEDMGQLHIFWRPAPDQPFPWENKE